MAEGQFKEGIAGGRLAADAVCGEFFRPASAARPARGAGRGRPLLLLLRRAVHARPARPASTSRCSSAQIADRQPERRGRDHPRARTSSAACAPASARPRRCARRPACARSPRASRSQIGRLQRYATDIAHGRGQAVLSSAPRRPARRSPWSAPARRASPARTGSPCSAMTSRSSRRAPKAGGLNEYGIAAYKTPDDFAQARGRLRPRRSAASTIAARPGARPRRHARRPAPRLRRRLPRPRPWRRQRAARRGRGRRTASTDAVDFIAELRQAGDLAGIAGRPPRRRHRRRHDGDRRRRADQAARRRGGDDRLPPRPGADERLRVRAGAGRRPTASSIRHWLQPKRVVAEGGKVAGIELEYTAIEDGRLAGTGETLPLAADLVFKAIGQTFVPADVDGAARSRWRAAASRSTPSGRTSLAGRLGRRRLRRRRRGPHRRGGRGRQAGRAVDRPRISRAPLSARAREEHDHGRPAHQFRRHQVAQPVLARLRAADRQGLQRRARLRGGLGRRGLEDARRGRPAGRQRQRPALRRDLGRRPPPARPQQHRADHRPRRCEINLREIKQVKTRLAGPRADRLADGAVRGGEPGRRSCRWSRRPAPTASSSTSAARTA